MKKRILTLCLILVFGVIIGPLKVHAQEAVIETETPVGIDTQASQSAITKERVNYELPYPGMLPDSPLYFLKALRDRVVKLLINEDMVMAKFNLNSAEKRIFAGKLLLDKDKKEHSIESVMKGVNYYEEAIVAIDLVRTERSANVDMEPFLQKTSISLAKSYEVIGDMKNSLRDSDKNMLHNEQKRINAMIKKVELLLDKK